MFSTPKKRCGQCGVSHPVFKFRKDEKTADGRYWRCLGCDSRPLINWPVFGREHDPD